MYKRPVRLPTLMMFDQFVLVLKGAVTDGDLARQKLKNDAIGHILASDIDPKYVRAKPVVKLRAYTFYFAY